MSEFTEYIDYYFFNLSGLLKILPRHIYFIYFCISIYFYVDSLFVPTYDFIEIKWEYMSLVLDFFKALYG